jgi:hypothetical protein
MESERPYSGGDYVGERPDRYALASSRDVIIANIAYAEGRKAAEKDFQELLELANQLREYPWDEFEAFDAWKKARGIE